MAHTLVSCYETCPAPRLSSYRFGQLALEIKREGPQFDHQYLTYMTPEQYEGEEVTERSDQYCLGLLAMAMAQGEPPVGVERLAGLEKKMVFCKDPKIGIEYMKTNAAKT